jgi:hypothetical protein
MSTNLNCIVLYDKVTNKEVVVLGAWVREMLRVRLHDGSMRYRVPSKRRRFVVA